MSLYPIYIDSSVSGAQLSIGTTNASTIQIGPLTQKTDAPIVSTLINGVRIDSNSTTQNLIVTLSSNPYSVNNYPLTNTNNTMVSNIGFSVNMSGSFCTAVGHNCLTNNTTGIRNDAFGSGAAQTITTGSYNTALGSRALAGSTSSSGNVAVGYEALFTSVVTEYPNVAVGYQALQLLNNSASGANVAVGYKALGGLTTGLGNIAIGHQAENCALGIKTSGYDNVVIGTNSASGNYNRSIVLGADAVATGNDQIILGKAGGAHTTWIQGGGGLNVNGGPTTLGTTTAYTLSAGGATLANGGYACRAGVYGEYSNTFNWFWDGYVFKGYVDNVHVGTICDYRIKENIKPTSPVLDKLCSINMFDFTHKELSIFKPNGNHIGFFAHELKETFKEYPKLVSFEKDDLNEDGTIKFQLIEMPILNLIIMKAVQEQNTIVKDIIKENEDLKLRLSAIEARLAAGI